VRLTEAPHPAKQRNTEMVNKITIHFFIFSLSDIKTPVHQAPTIHMGVAAVQMERKGIRTDRGDRNRITQVQQLGAVRK
jgi:hypothetical protein